MTEPSPGEGAPGLLRYPLEYFAAQLAFASKIADVTGQPLWEAIATYTPLREEVIGAAFLDHPNAEVWDSFVQRSGGAALPQMAADLYARYIRQPHAIFQPAWVPRGSTRFGSLGVDTSAYNRQRNQVKLHFLPTRHAGSDLATAKIAARQADMQRLLRFVKAAHPDLGLFTSYSWLQHLPNYQALFPPAFLARRVELRDRFLGLWGQFVHWDGRANQRRYAQFLHTLADATSLDQAIDAIPLSVLGAVGPLTEFYDWYQIE